MYTIIGNGRVARHFAHYFRFEQIPFRQWSRSKPAEAVPEEWIPSLPVALRRSSHVLVLISDQAVEDFIQSNPVLEGKSLVHFSGSLRSPLAPSAHPLMTFGPDLYPLETYQSIPFILEKGRDQFEDLLPGLQNRHYSISPDLKPLYHSLCVLSGNFTTILWSKFFRELADRFGIPQEVAYPFLERTAKNLQSAGISSLTGPLARADLGTIKQNLEALEGDPFQAVYRAFIEASGLSPPEKEKS